MPLFLSYISQEMFPTLFSFIIFILYIVLFINQGILVTATKNDNNSYNYNTVTVVLLTEFLKLVASALLYLKDHALQQFFADVSKHTKVFLLYFVPASLYCVYNNLQFTNLAAYDPTTYFLLLQFRVVVTGIVFQILFKKQLNRKQWLSLMLLTIGCIIKEAKFESEKSEKSFVNVHLFLIIVQMFCSCFAGVYNEYLLKDTGAEVPIMLQNVFMYVNSILCNAMILLYQGQLVKAFTPEALDSVLKPKVVGIIMNMAAVGIVTSLFLRNLNSILKTFASALELMFTAVLCWLIFGIAIDVLTVVAIFIVISATFMYSQNPVVNRGKLDDSSPKKEDMV